MSARKSGSFAQDLKRMTPVWGIVFLTAAGSLLAIRHAGVDYLRQGWYRQEDACHVGNIEFLAGERIMRGLRAQVKDSQQGRTGQSTLGRLKDDARASEATSHFERALELCPFVEGAHLALADLAWWDGDEPASHYHLGMENVRFSKWDKARIDFETALQLAPENVRYGIALAEVAANQGRWSQVKEALGALNPEAKESPEALRLQGALDLSEGRLQDAIQMLKKSLSLQKGNDRSTDLLLRAAALTPDPVEPVEFLLENLKEATSPSPNAYHRVALILIRNGQDERALEALERALAIAPNSVELLFDKAACLHRLGRYNEARLAAELAISRDFDTYQRLVSDGNVDPMKAP